MFLEFSLIGTLVFSIVFVIKIDDLLKSFFTKFETFLDIYRGTFRYLYFCIFWYLHKLFISVFLIMLSITVIVTIILFTIFIIIYIINIHTLILAFYFFFISYLRYHHSLILKVKWNNSVRVEIKEFSNLLYHYLSFLIGTTSTASMYLLSSFVFLIISLCYLCFCDDILVSSVFWVVPTASIRFLRTVWCYFIT